MTHQTPPGPSASDPGKQLAQLRELLRLVEAVAGRAGATPSERQLDDAARLSAAYDRALPILQRRFDSLAGEVAAWAAAGVETLTLAPGAGPAAAGRLADALAAALDELAAMLEDSPAR